MRKFILGFAVGIVAILVGMYVYVRFGFADPRADVPVGALEAKIAMPALDAAVDRRAVELQNPVQPNDESLLSGMKIYQANCASCHGDIKHPQAPLANALYPRAPQFTQDAPDMPENQNFYIIQHGIRLSGMLAWKDVLSTTQMWQVTTFLSHMDKLPPNISQEWNSAADGTPGQSAPPVVDQKGHTGMKM